MPTVEMITGDWSADGHGITQTSHYEISCSPEQLEEYYKIGSKRLGFNLTENIACEYETSMIEDNHLSKLIEHGFKAHEVIEDIEEDGDEMTGYLDHDSFCEIYFFIAKIGAGIHPFSYFVEFDDVPKFRIGGYGLYSM